MANKRVRLVRCCIVNGSGKPSPLKVRTRTCAFDELHAQTTRDLYENLESAMAKRDNNLLLDITTAGYDRLSVCYEERNHVIEAITPGPDSVTKVFPDETLFGLIYTIDDSDDWTQEENWVKANPNWGVSVELETFIRDARRAIFTTHKQPSFQMKHLNMWVSLRVLTGVSQPSTCL